MAGPDRVAAATGPAAGLRPIGPFDLDGVAALHAACFDDAWSAPAIAAILATPGTYGFVSLAGDSPTGFVLARVAADEAEILSIGVLPAARRRGAGRALLAAAMRHAAASGAARLHLEVAADNRPARALYGREGFAQSGRRPAYYSRPGGRADALVLSCRLGPAGMPGASGPD